VLAHKSAMVAQIADHDLDDDYIAELDWSGKVLWEWRASAHFDELGFTPEARAAIREAAERARGAFDWLHVNSMSYVGPNRWYDDGDRRFAPDNIIISSRQASIIAILDRTGAVVWRVGPDSRDSEALAKLGQIIGQHNPHVIPEGLPGAGNVLVFDNGGASGYGYTTPSAPDGENAVARDSSRVLEFDPTTLAKIWEYTIGGQEHYRFYSHYISSAQRLANGNTLITEGADGRIFEVTPAKEIVWEYVSPFFSNQPTPPGVPPSHRIYRAYRIPYDWVPQAGRPEERAVKPPQLSEFRVPSQ
jgi:outer membrane protein assembly factor BamB